VGSPEIKKGVQEPERGDRIAEYLLLCQVLAATLLQKFALPGSGRMIPLSLAVMLGAVLAGVLSGRLAFRPAVCAAYLSTMGVLVLMAALGLGSRLSITSLALLVVIHLPYLFTLGSYALRPNIHLSYFNNVVCLIAVLGVAQFFLQFLVGAELAFALDTMLPKDLLLAGYNNLNELRYGGTTLKSNGVFLLEPSFMSQFIAIAIIIELLYFRRTVVLAVYGIGLIVTYSGTGLIILALLGPLVLIRQKHFMPLAVAGLVLALAVLFAESLDLSVFAERLSEFQHTRTSGFARFVSMFLLLEEFVWNDARILLFGRGPGSVTEFFDWVNYEAYEPSWGKLIYEYGLIGFACYCAFIFGLVSRAQQSNYVKAALMVQFFLLAGFVLIPFAHALILALLVWPRPAASEAFMGAATSRIRTSGWASGRIRQETIG